MTTERPDSPVGRIAPVPFHYCADCHCESCGRVFSRTFCPRCSCAACTKDSKDHAYIPEHEEDDQPSALGKRKQESLVLAISPVKRVKADSVNTAIRKLVNEASISAANAALPVPSNVNRFCLVSLGHSPEDCLETCHIVPRALGEDNVLFFQSSNAASTNLCCSSSKSSNLPGVFVTMASIFIPGTT